MKVAAIQMPTVKDKIQNIRTAGTYIEKIKAENPDFVILPEMFCCPYQTENFPVYAEKEGGPSWQEMSDYARKYHIYLIAGPCRKQMMWERFTTLLIFLTEMENRLVSTEKLISLISM